MSYELLFIARVTSYFYCESYELLFIARVTSYFLNTSCGLLFTARVTIKYTSNNKAVYDDKIMVKNYSLR